MNEHTRLPLFVNQDIPLSINAQLKEQIKYLIIQDILKPGDSLPTVVQLAEQLQINRNTINWVYTQLKEEGLLSMSKGRRTQVEDNVYVQQLIERRILNNIVEHSMNEAYEKGFSFEEYVASVMMHHHLFADQSNKKQFWLVECKEHDYLFYTEEIKRQTNAQIRTVFIEEIKQNPAAFKEEIEKVDGIITTLNHSNEVEMLFNYCGKPVYTIGAVIIPSALMEVARLNPGTKVCFVCLGEKGGKWMAKKITESGITQIKSYIVGTGNYEKLHKLIEDTDLIYASSAVYDSIKKMSPQKTHLLPFQLEQTSQKLLRDIG